MRSSDLSAPLADKPTGKHRLAFLSDYVVLDLETTGLSPAKCAIIEIGIVKVENYTVAGTFQTFVHPGFHISSLITGITGITDAMLVDAPHIAEVLPRALDFIGTLPVIAHNAAFDLGFLNQSCINCLGTPFANDWLDTMRLSRKLFPHERHHRLMDLVNRLGIGKSVAHRALSDADQTQKCYARLCDYAADNHISLASPPKKPKGKPAQPIKNEKIAGKRFLFSDAISPQNRNKAAKKIRLMGGEVFEAGNVDFLVIEDISYSLLRLGSLQKTGGAVRLPGKEMKIISEAMLWEMLEDIDGFPST